MVTFLILMDDKPISIDTAAKKELASLEELRRDHTTFVVVISKRAAEARSTEWFGRVTHVPTNRWTYFREFSRLANFICSYGKISPNAQKESLFLPKFKGRLRKLFHLSR